MDCTGYEAFTKRINKPGEDILSSLDPQKAVILHMCLGLSGEVGELVDALKKYVIYGKDLDMENVVEELGDLEYYLQVLRTTLNLDREQIISTNYNKLSKRYHQGSYSDEQAINREDKNQNV